VDGARPSLGQAAAHFPMAAVHGRGSIYFSISPRYGNNHMVSKGKKQKLRLFSFLSGRGVDCVLCEWSRVKEYFERRNVG